MSALYNVFYWVWKTEQIPSEWHNSKLVQIWKHKNPASDLSNWRHVHLKSESAKLFGFIVMSEARETTFTNMSKFQIATKPGHRSSEHIFFIESILALFQSQKRHIFLRFGTSVAILTLNL